MPGVDRTWRVNDTVSLERDGVPIEGKIIDATYGHLPRWVVRDANMDCYFSVRADEMSLVSAFDA
jgi:hypothetical protein